MNYNDRSWVIYFSTAALKYFDTAISKICKYYVISGAEYAKVMFKDGNMLCLPSLGLKMVKIK